uniref:Uncharacterized protein n=1 Tax=viral metagenome TaxID=1070528 RepID=A0A6C0AEF9_9ZZZZ
MKCVEIIIFKKLEKILEIIKITSPVQINCVRSFSSLF